MANQSDERPPTANKPQSDSNPNRLNPNCVLKSNRPSWPAQPTQPSQSPQTSKTKQAESQSKPSTSTSTRASAAAAAFTSTSTSTCTSASRSSGHEQRQHAARPPPQASSSQHESSRRRHQELSTASERNSANNNQTPQSNVNKRQANINYWNYKQTGIKSRPIKLLKHPIEHIERKIIITYLLSFLFKLIAILTGPFVVLLAYLITVPLLLSRNFLFWLLNSKLTCDAKIKSDSCRGQVEPDEAHRVDADADEGAVAAAADWRYCPLTYIESYWLKERLVNNVLLVLDNHNAPFSIHNFRQLVRQKILAKDAFRKFSCNVLAKGLPLFKSYYWHHLQFRDDQEDDDCAGVQVNSPRWPAERSASASEGSSSLQTVVDQFSVTSIASSNDSAQKRRLDLESQNWQTTTTNSTSSSLSEHIFLDANLVGQVHLGSVRRYVHRLIDVGLDLQRPLWEVRVIPSDSERKTYLIFRCHQSLADGKSLSRILTDCLSGQPSADAQHLRQVDARADPPTSRAPSDGYEQSDKAEEDEAPTPLPAAPAEDETELKPLKEKRSFVAKISKSNSWRSAIFVGPLTVMLWVIWTFTRRKHNHLNRCLTAENVAQTDERRFYMAHYSLTKFHQIKQMTRSTVNDVILCALSGALRDYLRKYNGVTNPPNLNISLIVDMRQPDRPKRPHEAASGRAGPSTSASTISRAASVSSQYEQEANKTPRRDTGGGGGGGNQVNCALVNVPLPTSVYGTVPRLWDVRNTMDELRTSADPWVMLGLQRFLFHLLPVVWYQRLVNYISLRNSSTFVSNLHGPETRVEAWCVDLLQRAVYESQQPACAIQPNSITSDQPYWWPDRAVSAATGECEPEEAMKSRRRRRRSEQNKATRLKLLGQLGSIRAIYYCMQPPTSSIPISFNCISYHDKLFITSLSRSLLVENSKILIKLFFKHLDQLADTIAKRRSLLTIIRTATPVEISCQPASPVTSRDFVIPVESQIDQDEDGESSSIQNEAFDEERDNIYERQTISPASSGILFRSVPKDDTIIGGRKNKCSTCEQLVCTCRRRKSLFNFDYNKQRAVNLLSLLHPANFITMRTSRSQEVNQFGDSEQGNSPSECACGKQLLEELDEDGGTSSRLALNLDDKDVAGGRNVSKSLSSEDNSEPVYGQQAGGGGRVTCAECRLLAAQSSLSLDLPADQKRRYEMRAKKNSNSDQNIKNSNLSIVSRRTNQLRTPKRGRLDSKQHSRSETDLLPGNRGGKLSPKVIQQRSMVVVKDEINADVTLRYQIDGQSFLGIRNRRFSTIGSAVAGTQRRASLIPFGLIQNSSISKLFKDDGEAHV